MVRNLYSKHTYNKLIIYLFSKKKILVNNKYTYENSNINILNQVYNTLYNQNTITKMSNFYNCRLGLFSNLLITYKYEFPLQCIIDQMNKDVIL